MKRKFRAANGKVYTIDESQVESFMKSFPDAVEVTEYSANGKSYSISEDQLPGFMNAFPDAFPEKKKESTEPTAEEETTPQGVGSQGMQTPLQQRVELSEKKSRVNNSVDELYSIQREMEGLVIASRNPSYDVYRQAATKSQVNQLYDKSQKLIAELKKGGGKNAEYYYPGIEQAINNIKTKSDQAHTQGWDPEYTKSQLQPDFDWLKNGLHEVEKASGKPGIMSKEKANVDLAKYTENVKKAQAEINKLGIQGRKDGWSKEEMEKYLNVPMELIRKSAEELSGKLPENQRYIASGMIDSAKALKDTYVASVGAWNDKQTQDYTTGHNQWAAKTVSEIENAYNITTDQQRQAGGVADAELDAYIMKGGKSFYNIDVKTIKQANQAAPTTQATIMVGGKGEADKKVMDAAVSDYFTYMDNTNPSMAKAWREKYEYLKNGGASLDAGDEEFLLEFEKKAMRLAMGALDRKIKDEQFEIASDSEFEKSLDLDKYRRSMMELEGESKKIQTEYDAANKKAKEVQNAFNVESGELTRKIKNLQELLEGGMISEDDYTMMVSPLINELNDKQTKAEANMPNFEDLQARQDALNQNVARIADETGVNDAALEKLQGMGEKYAQYGESYQRMNALVDMNGKLGSFYYSLKERERDNQRSAEFRAKGFDSELGREIEEGPWYKEYAAKGLHYTVGQIWGSEAMRGFGGFVGNQTVGLLELPAVYSALSGSEGYGWTDKLMDMTINFKKSSGREGSFGDVTQYGYDIWMPGKIANFGGNTAGSIAMFMMPGKYLNAGTKLTKWATNWGSSFLLSQSDMYEENLEVAKEYNKSAQWAAAVTQGEAAVLATIELMVGDLDYMKTPEVRKSIARAFAEGKTMPDIIKRVIDAAPESVSTYFKKMIPEGIEEGSGSLGTDAYKEYLINGKVQYFNDTFNWENIGMDVLGGFVGGAIGNAMNRPIKTKDLEVATYLSALHADQLYKNASNEKNLKDLKDKLEGPKKDLEILSTHTNWNSIDDGSKVRAFSLNQSVKGLQEQIETDKKNNIVDEKKVQQLAEMTEEMNEILSAPEAAKGASSDHYNNTRDLIEALQSNDSDLSDIIENPIWGRLTEDSRTSIEDISYDIRNLNESMKKMDKRSPEYKAALDQVSQGKKQIKEILNNTQAYDSKNIPGVSSPVGEGQEPVGAESQQRASAGTPEAGGVLQAPKAPEQVVEELTKAIEDDNRAIEETGDAILTPEARADMERQLFEAKNEQAKAAAEVTTEQPTAEGEAAPTSEVTTQPSTEGAVTEEVKPQQKTDQQKEITRLEGLLAQDDQAMKRTGKGILASRPAVESQLETLREQEKMTEKEDTRTEEETKRDEKEYESNKKSIKKVDPTLTERQADLATALFQQGMDAKKAIEEAKKKISLEERASKMKEVSEKVLAERKGRIAKEMGATAESLGKFFKNAGMKVKYVDNAEEFEREYSKNGANKETEGMFIATDGTIVFNREILEETWDKFGKNIMFHEAIHPVMNIIRNTDKKLYSSIVNGLKNEMSRNADIKAAWDFANQDQYKRQGEEVVEDEFIVESLAMIADGKLKLSTLPKQKRNFLIKALSKLGLKFGQKPLPENADDEALRKFADKLHKSLTKGGLLEDIVGEENVTKFANTIESLKTLTSDVIEPGPLAQQSARRKDIYGDKIKYKQGGYDLSFVKKEDLVDIEKLIKQIADEKAVVWFWTADQLGRGMYSDETIEGEHYLDAGPSYALDPENRKMEVIWASGADEKTLMNRIEASDYIFIISGSPQQSKLFNKAVIDFLRKRTEKASGLSWNDFTKKVMELTTKTTQKGDVKKTEITKLLEKYNSFEELISAEGNDRKKLFVEMEKNRITTNSPLSQYLKSIGLSFDVDTLRDGFYKENGFDINDVMLILKPTGLGGTSKHGTYKNDIKGEVVGIPDRRVNGIDLLPEERRKKYSEAQRKAPMTGAAGSLTSELGQASQGGRTLPENMNIVDGWYSPIEKRLRETNADKQSAQKWLTSGMIGKGDEAIYTGVKGWLEGKKPNDQVSKQEILDWMRDNRVEIREESAGRNTTLADARKVFEDRGYDVVTDRNGDTYVEKDEELYDYNDMSPEEQKAFEILTSNNLESETKDESLRETTKYHNYVLEGEKSNYKELKVTLPSRVAPMDNPNVIITKEFKAPNGSVHFKVFDKSTGKEYKHIGAEGSTPESVRYQVLIKFDLQAQQRVGQDFISPHFDEANILVHLRMNTRTDVDGNKVLFLEEVQSDWGQKGKKEGFEGDTEKQVFNNFKYEVIEVSGKKLYTYFTQDGETVVASSENREQAKIIAENKARKMAQSIYTREVPKAPYVTDTNAWTKLGLKMALREAVKQGADRVAWTTGEQQNQRYDLKKDLNYLDYWKNDNGTYGVELSFKTPQEFTKPSELTEKELNDYFGKEIASKIVSDTSSPTENNPKRLEGDDLSVGGKGMKGFYDNIIPSVATALSKELTGKSTTIVPTTILPGLTQQSIEITPELKAAVQEGMPQFSQGGRIGPEVDYVTKNGKVSFTNIEVPKGFNIVSEQEGYGTLYDPYDRVIMQGDVRDIGKRIKSQYPVGTPSIKDATTLDLYSNVNRFTLKQLGDILQNLDPEGDWNTMVSDVDNQKSPEAADELEIRLLAEAREALQGRVDGMLRADKGDEELGFDVQKDGLGAKEPAKTSIGQLSQRGTETKEDSIKQKVLSESNITDLDLSRWMKENNVTSFSENPESIKKFEKDFGVKLSEDTIGQMSEKKAELPKRFSSLIKDVIDNIGNAYDSGMSIDASIKQGLTSQPWYDTLSDEQKGDMNSIVQGVFGEQLAAQREKEATEQGTREPLSDEVKSKTQELEDLYHIQLDGNNKEKKAAKEAQEKILDSDPKLKYIWKNYRNILKELQQASKDKIELTKSEACP